MKPLRIKISKTKAGKVMYSISSGNNRQLVSSQKTYESRRSAQPGLDALITGIKEGNYIIVDKTLSTSKRKGGEK